MLRDRLIRMTGAAVLLAALAGAPALADVKAGVDAWSRGDFAGAVREWEPLAAAGDVDAMFNLGQAYRLGRGVATDLGRAEDLYAAAAAKGHLQAADTYGLLLFQDGRREAALPYVRDAARRGDSRSQYLLGIAHFNGDLVEKDWIRAYALMTLANGAGLPQATPAIAEMDRQIPLEQRQQAAGLAIEMRNAADAARASELAAFDLAAQAPAATPSPASLPTAAPVVAAAAPPPASRAVPTSATTPSIAAARTAIGEATRATGTESPSQAGASYARTAPPVEVASAPTPASPPEPAAETGADTPAPAPEAAVEPAPSPAASGPWRIQLGAFSVAANAERLWSRLGGRAELSGRERLLVPAGRVTKLQAGGFASRSAAEAACRTLRQSGQDCLVTDR
jgi:cell division septation protein DedD